MENKYLCDLDGDFEICDTLNKASPLIGKAISDGTMLSCISVFEISELVYHLDVNVDIENPAL